MRTTWRAGIAAFVRALMRARCLSSSPIARIWPSCWTRPITRDSYARLRRFPGSRRRFVTTNWLCTGRSCMGNSKRSGSSSSAPGCGAKVTMALLAPA
jgi:hypothetical protein